MSWGSAHSAVGAKTRKRFPELWGGPQKSWHLNIEGCIRFCQLEKLRMVASGASQDTENSRSRESQQLSMAGVWGR